MSGPPRFVELIRVSGDAQEARDTPEDQRRALDALRISRPGVLVERIDLGAVSGAADKRPDLERLFSLAEARAFDELRVRHLDRLTRHDDLRQRAEIFGRMLDAGAVIVDGSGHIIDPTTEMGELDYSLQTWMSAKERRRILERTLAARKRKAAEGQIQGRPPWARTWDKRTATWGVDQPAMAVYRRLFAEVLAGKSLAEIAAGLNREGISTPLSREWTPAHVSRLLRHRGAVGEVRGWGRLFRCPPVVDVATFEAAQRALRAARATRSGPPGHHEALMRRVLSCGICGATMWVQRGGRPGDVRSFYVCSTNRRAADPDCRKWYAVADLDAEVQRLLLEAARHPERMRAAAERQQSGDALAEARAAVEAAAKALRRLDGEEERIARLMRRELLTERVAEKQLREIAKGRHQAEAEHAAAAARAGALERAAEERRDLTASLADLAQRLERATFAEWREHVRSQAVTGRVFPDGRIALASLLFGPGSARALRRVR